MRSGSAATARAARYRWLAGPRLLLGREMADALLFESQRIMPTALTDSGYTFSHPNLESGLRAVLGK